MLQNLQAVILAGGVSERFQTGKTKLIEKICGTEMILYPIHLLQSLHIPTTLVVGFQHDRIKKIIDERGIALTFVHQQKPLGTGHAAQLTKKTWNAEHVLLMNADIPLITPNIINKLYRQHTKTGADISFITAHGMDLDSSKYSRVVIDDSKIQVLEHFENESSDHCCISAGIYIAKKSFLDAHIDKLSKNESTGEYYLPELVRIASDHHCKIVTTPVSFDVVRSVDTLADLWAIEHIKRSQIMQHFMDHGVRFANTLNILIDQTVHIEPGSFIDSGAILQGNTVIKSGATIGAYSKIEDSIIEHNAVVPAHMIIKNSTITSKTQLTSFTTIDSAATAKTKALVKKSVTFTPTKKIEESTKEQ